MRAIRAGRAEVVESWAWEAAEVANPDATWSNEQAGALMDMFSSGAESDGDDLLAAFVTAKYVSIQCQDCQAKFQIDANRTMGKTVKVLCSQCGAHIHVADGKVVDATHACTPTPQDHEVEDSMVDPVRVLAWNPMIKFACPNCNAKYTLDPDKAKGRTIRLRCRKCGQHMELKGREPNPTGGTNVDTSNN